jgi:cell division protein FtsW
MLNRDFSISNRSALLSVVTFLCMIGLVSVYSSSGVTAAEKFHDELHYVTKQALVGIFGFTIIFGMGHSRLRSLDRVPIFIYILAFVLTCLVFMPGIGHHTKGATRWIRFGPVGFQPSELVKIGVILLTAKALTRPSCNMARFNSGLLPVLLLYAPAAVALLAQPDFGTAAVLLLVVLAMTFLAGLPLRFVGMGCVAALVGLAVAVVASPYRFRRLMTFLDPWSEYEGSGFQIVQSFLGFQSGGWFGKGIAASRQKLYFLPDAHTDFILSVFAEEYGAFGTLTICAMFAYLTYLGFRIAQCQMDPFRRLVAYGLTLQICFQALINMGVTLGLMPTKGIPLPFVSNGASSLLSFLFCVGILARLAQPDAAHEEKR